MEKTLSRFHDDEQLKRWKEYLIKVLKRVISGEVPPLANEMAEETEEKSFRLLMNSN